MTPRVLRFLPAALLVGLPLLTWPPPAAALTIDGPGTADEVDRALVQIDEFIAAQGIDTSEPGWRGKLPAPPELEFTSGTLYDWHLETNLGRMTIRLRTDFAPVHCSNVIYLSRLGFYDGLGFHRMIHGFMAQAGCPVGDGTGGPGYLFEEKRHPDARHDRRGVVSAVNDGPGTDGSQFFMLFNPAPHLDETNTPFGSLVGGLQHLNTLAEIATKDGVPSEPVVIRSAGITTEARGPLPSANDGDDPALETIAGFIASNGVDRSQEGWRLSLPKPPRLTFDESKSYFWHLRTRLGDMKVQLLPHAAPMHVSSVIYLTRLGYYDHLTFHRVVPKFIAQGGCPLGNGGGGPGYTLELDTESGLSHDASGVVSSANRGEGTEGSQFFMTIVRSPHLDGKHTIFGRLIDGWEELREINLLGRVNGRIKGPPIEIERATISVE